MSYVQDVYSKLGRGYLSLNAAEFTNARGAASAMNYLGMPGKKKHQEFDGIVFIVPNLSFWQDRTVGMTSRVQSSWPPVSRVQLWRSSPSLTVPRGAATTGWHKC